MFELINRAVKYYSFDKKDWMQTKIPQRIGAFHVSSTI